MEIEKKLPPFSDIALGRHLTVEYYDCCSEILANAKKMEEIFIYSAKKSGATVLGCNFHDFQPQGVSGFVIIAESHFSVHAWPEHDYAAVDIFTCGEQIDFQAAVDTLQDKLKSESVIISSVMSRGIVGNNGIERLVPVYADSPHTYALAWKTKFATMNAWGILNSIDIHECDDELLHSSDKVIGALNEFCGELGLSGVVAAKIVPFDEPSPGSGFTFCYILDNGSQISGNLSHQRKCVYLDIFSTKYFEPRIAAEQALSSFMGRHYRMQVAVRR